MSRENRKPELASLRAVVDVVQSECDTMRESWPDRYPVPPEVDAVYSLEDAVIARARGSNKTT